MAPASALTAAGPSAPERRGGVRRHSNTFYSREAEEYAARTGASGRPPLLDAFINELPASAKVLDLGCGAGRDLSSLAAAGIDCFGIDLSPELAQIAQKRTSVPVDVMDMRALRLEENSLDGVLAVASLLHLDTEEMDGQLGRISNWLRPAGLILTTMKIGVGVEVAADGRAFALVQRDEWARRLERAGMTIIREAISSAAPGVASSDHAWLSALARNQGAGSAGGG